MITDLLHVIPCPIDLGCGAGPIRPKWTRYVRESELRAGLEAGNRQVFTYTRDGRRHSQIAAGLPPGLAAAYLKRHGSGKIHRSYFGTGAIFTPVKTK